MYAFNNPVLFSDPYGLNPTPPKFNSAQELFNYISSNGLSGFSEGFTRYEIGEDGNVSDPMYASVLSQNKEGKYGVRYNYSGWGNNTYGQEGEQRELVIGRKWVSLEKFSVDWNLYNDNIYQLTNPVNNALTPFAVPLAGIEYQVGKGLGKFNRLDQIKPYNEQWRLNNNPYLKTRPVNVEIPFTGRTIQAPRNVIKNISKGLQALGVVSAGVSIANDVRRYQDGDITATHLVVNTVMNGVGFLGPVGARVSIIYGLTEDWWW